MATGSETENPKAGTMEQGGFRMVGEVGTLFEALAKATQEFKPIERTKTVAVTPRDTTKKSYTFKYAPLDTLIAATRPALAKHGLDCFQPFHASRYGGWVLRTILSHSSGAFVETCDYIDEVKILSNQDLGSTVTYRRRYAYAAMLGVVAEEDDDANIADGNGWGEQPQAAAKTPPRTRGRGRQKPDAKSDAVGSFVLPPNWPGSTMEELHPWIDKLDSSAAMLQAIKLFTGPESPIISQVERAPLVEHVAINYHLRLEQRDEAARAKMAPITKQIDAAREAVKKAATGEDLDKQGKELF